MSEQRAREYTVRPFHEGDVDAFLALYREVFPGEHGREWFDWKYASNPYVDHVPMYVAESDGDIVGARPFMAFEMAVDGDRHLALQPGDAMVHPEHRRQGLFTRMTEAAIERYEAGDPSFFFNFPNDRTLRGNLKLGWRSVGTVPTYYRIQDPVALLSADRPGTWTGLAGRAARPCADAYLRLRDGLAAPDGAVTVHRDASVPPGRLAALADDRARDGIHAVRDETFYDWRFDNPDWDYATYVASADGDDLAAAVVGTGTDAGVHTTKLTDVVPAPRNAPSDSLGPLVHRIVADHPESDVLVAPSLFRRSTLRPVGFHGDDQPPLSALADRTTHVTRSLTGSWTVGGLDITDGDNWSMTFAEQDTS